MSDDRTTYDLVLLLDASVEDAAKQSVITAARAAIERKGELVRHDEWGLRPLAYQIAHKAEAEYHLLQFTVADVTLLSELDRSLRITDGVLRFMITKVKRGTPEPPQVHSSRGQRHAEEATPAAA
jgi:small subunit ribosomal protein S6